MQLLLQMKRKMTSSKTKPAVTNDPILAAREEALVQLEHSGGTDMAEAVRSAMKAGLIEEGWYEERTTKKKFWLPQTTHAVVLIAPDGQTKYVGRKNFLANFTKVPSK